MFTFTFLEKDPTFAKGFFNGKNPIWNSKNLHSQLHVPAFWVRARSCL